MVRMICQFMNHGEYKGAANIYAYEEVISLIRDMANKLLLEKETKFIDDRLHLITVSDGEERIINERKVTFFDIHSNPCAKKYAEKSKWLLHEVFCLYSQSDIFDPYEKHHSTAKDACALAETLEDQNLLLYHKEDKNIRERKELYVDEGKKYYTGNLYVPNDLETIEL